MQLDERSNKLLDELISNPSVMSKDLERKYNLTRRQFGYSFNKINDWLKSKTLPVIERTKQGHFIIDQTIFSKLNGEQSGTATMNILSEKQRVHMIILMLLSSEDELSLVHFTSGLEVSKNTILNDLKRTESLVSSHGLHVRYPRQHGYLMDGNEFHIRKLLINTIYNVLEMNNGKEWLWKMANINQDEISELSSRIEKIENKLNLKFTDEKIETLPYTLVLVLRRINNGDTIDSFHIKYEELSDTKEYRATEEILYDVVDVALEERLFITLHILTANVYWSEFLPEDAIPNLQQALNDMLHSFEQRACISLQDRDQLLRKLLLHVKPAYYRIKYQLT
ncbi:BglG family transcription antiterminator [Virgibacillus sp. DJP39]|uniref:BglG family transcription antiterminator n=1 Tax=Virgibacillus sp. DJP39 TaxID=3409790 RepID=UPI003BB63876